MDQRSGFKLSASQLKLREINRNKIAKQTRENEKRNERKERVAAAASQSAASASHKDAIIPPSTPPTLPPPSSSGGSSSEPYPGRPFQQQTPHAAGNCLAVSHENPLARAAPELGSATSDEITSARLPVSLPPSSSSSMDMDSTQAALLPAAAPEYAASDSFIRSQLQHGDNNALNRKRAKTAKRAERQRAWRARDRTIEGFPALPSLVLKEAKTAVSEERKERRRLKELKRAEEMKADREKALADMPAGEFVAPEDLAEKQR